MARIIINDGSGPRDVELSGLVVLGSNPSCDVVLEHPTAIGCRVELKPLRWGYRAKCVKGEMMVNEAPAEMADLEHNDTLRVGEVMVLYKQPESADEFATGAASADTAPPPTEAAADSSSDASMGSLEDELGSLSLEADESFELESLDFGEESAPAPEGGGMTELEPESDLFEELVPEPSEPAAPPPAEDFSAEFDLTIQRARWKRLEALRRLRLIRDGSDEIFIDISKPKALEEVETLDAKGETGDLEAYEAAEGLTDKTVAELLALGEEAYAARAAAEPEEELAELEVEEEPLQELEVAEEPVEGPGDLAELEVEAEDEELEELLEPEELVEPEPAAPVASPGPVEVAEVAEPADADDLGEPLESVVEPPSTEAEEYDLTGAAAASVAAAADLDSADDLEELSDLDELEPADEPDEVDEPLDEPVVAPVVLPEPEPVAVAASATASVPPVATVPAAALETRPLPPGGVRFRRPLPPGARPPTFLPPIHPGAPPA